MPRALDDIEPVEPRWRTRHLPQGAPTSPALANLSAYRLDVRLDALASKLGAHYTRYADDVAFSGDERLVESGPRRDVVGDVRPDYLVEGRNRLSTITDATQREERAAGTEDAI